MLLTHLEQRAQIPALNMAAIHQPFMTIYKVLLQVLHSQHNHHHINSFASKKIKTNISPFH